MKTLTIKGKEYQLRNLGSEVTLNEMAKVAHILENEKKDFTEKWLEVIALLGSKELTEVITLKQFTEAVEAVQITNLKNDVQPEIEVNGRKYVAMVEDGKIQLTARDLVKIEQIVRKGGAWGNKAFAVCYKDVDLTNTEHYTDAHIDHKANIFGQNVNADIAAPVIFQLSLLIVEHVERLANAQGISVQGD